MRRINSWHCHQDGIIQIMEKKAVEVNTFSLKINTSKEFQGKNLLSRALGRVVHSHRLFFDLWYQMWLDQTANNSVHHPAGKNKCIAIYSSASISCGLTIWNDLNDHKAVLFKIQNRSNLKKSYLVGLLIAKLFRILLLWVCLEVPVKFVLFSCKPRWKCSTKYDPNQLKHLQVTELWPKGKSCFCQKNT